MNGNLEDTIFDFLANLICEAIAYEKHIFLDIEYDNSNGIETIDIQGSDDEELNLFVDSDMTLVDAREMAADIAASLA